MQENISEDDLELALVGGNDIEKVKDKINSLEKSIEKLTQELEEKESQPDSDQQEIEKLKEQIKKLQKYLKIQQKQLEELEKEEPEPEKPEPKPEPTPEPENNQLQELNRQFKEEWINDPSILPFIVKKKSKNEEKEEELKKIFSVYAKGYCSTIKLTKEKEITIELNSLTIKTDEKFEVQYTMFDDKADKIIDSVELFYKEAWI